MKGVLLGAVLLSSVLTAGVAVGEDLVLARRNESAGMIIVVAPGADEAVGYASCELQTFIRRMTGVELPVTTNATVESRVIRLVNCPEGDGRLDCEDAFRLQVKDGGLTVRGGGSRGVLYGVYELLERFGGCGWFAPGCETIPEREVLAVPADLDVVERPAFLQRETSWINVLSNDAFAARLRFDGRRQDKPLYGGTAYPFVKGLNLCHTFRGLVPPEKWFTKHPEWFSEIDGHRLGENSQLCCTNPELVKFAVQEIRERLKANPQARFVGVSQNDNRNYCRCADCAALAKAEGSQAGPYMKFVNAIAEEIEKDHPDVLIETLAYQYTRKPPKRIRPRRNVAICLCSFECAFERPFDQSSHWETKCFARDLRKWGAICPNLFIYNYAVNFSNYLYPFPNLRTIVPNYRLFLKNGARWIYDQANGRGYHGDLADLKCYLQSKLMWNSDRDVDQLIDRFLPAYYGKAAPFVRQYLDELYAAFDIDVPSGPEPGARVAHSSIYCERLPWLDDAKLTRWADLWQEAEKAVQDDSERHFRVRMSALSVLYVRLKRAYERNYKSVWAAEDLRPYLEMMAALEPLAGELMRRYEEASARGCAFRLAEQLPRHRGLMKQFSGLEGWVPPTNGCSRAVVTPDQLVKVGQLRNAVGLPIRLIACDSNATYRVKALLRKQKNVSRKLGQVGDEYGFSAGLHEAYRKNKGMRRMTFPKSAVTDEWVWHDLGEYDFFDLQKIPCSTMNGLCLYVQGEVEIGELEISKEMY